MGSSSGRVLIAGTASLLMCLFLSPRFIIFLRNREFGQNIREEGPRAITPRPAPRRWAASSSSQR